MVSIDVDLDIIRKHNCTFNRGTGIYAYRDRTGSLVEHGNKMHHVCGVWRDEVYVLREVIKGLKEELKEYRE